MKIKSWRFVAVVGLMVLLMAGTSGAAKWRYQDLDPSGLHTNVPVNAINDAKQMVGSYLNSGTGHTQAFIWDPVTGFTPLPPLGADTINSYAYGINKKGQIVGSVLTASGYYHACLWTDPSQAPTDLGALSGYTSSYAYAINDGGLIVGHAEYFDSTAHTWVRHACKWTTPGQPPIDLGPGQARAVNNTGLIVGSTGNDPCLWQPGQSAQVIQLGVGPLYAGGGAGGINNYGIVAGSYRYHWNPDFNDPKDYCPVAFYWNSQTGATYSMMHSPGRQGYWGTSLACGPSDSNVIGIYGNEDVIPGLGIIQPSQPFIWGLDWLGDPNQLLVNLPPGVTIKGLHAVSPNGIFAALDSRGHRCLLTATPVLTGVYKLLLLD